MSQCACEDRRQGVNKIRKGHFGCKALYHQKLELLVKHRTAVSKPSVMILKQYSVVRVLLTWGDDDSTTFIVTSL